MRRAVFAGVLLLMWAGVASAQGQAAPKGDPEAGAVAAGVSLAVLAVLVVGGAVVYFAPMVIAMLRGHPNTASIAVVNFFLGWSLIGWVVALAWSFSATEAKRYRSG